MGKRQSFREKVSYEIEKIKEVAAIGAGLGLVYLGCTVVVNAVISPLLLGFNGLERVVGGERKIQSAKLVDKKWYTMPSGSRFICGKFNTLEGNSELCDTYDFIEGKFLPNTGGLGSAEVGKEYVIASLEGPISSKLIRMKPIS